jgi:hypothetical protein
VVNADNDYAFASAPLTATPAVTHRNNLAQRNLSVIDVLAGARASFPFIAGSRYSFDASMTLVIDRSRLPAGMPLLLSLDDDGSAFPLVDFEPPAEPAPDDNPCGERAIVFLDKARIRTRFGCCEGVMTLEAGSRFNCVRTVRLGRMVVLGGEVVLRGERRYVEVRESTVRVQVQKTPNAIYALSLQTTIPADAAPGQQYLIEVAQEDARGVTVGGAAVVYVRT